MRRKQVEEAVKEAERFLAKARKLIETNSGWGQDIPRSRDSGSCRRASLDLSRALIEMRKSK